MKHLSVMWSSFEGRQRIRIGNFSEDLTGDVFVDTIAPTCREAAELAIRALEDMVADARDQLNVFLRAS